MVEELFPQLRRGGDDTALRFGTTELTYSGLARAVSAVLPALRGHSRIALWATPTANTAVGAVAALSAGVAAVPINPKIGEAELAHIVADAAPENVLAAPGDELPEPLAALPRTDVNITVDGPVGLGDEPGPDTAALIVYTSGTTGPPKGAVLPRRAITTTLDDLAVAWRWSHDDTVVHALPLFHVHGLVLGLFGPLRRAGSLHHIGRFDLDELATALDNGGTMLFAVPTMYHRIAGELDARPPLARALAATRALISGSAALSLPDHHRITAHTGRHVIERYGMTETLMNTSVRLGGTPKPGSVGVPLDSVELRLVDDDGAVLDVSDGETIGEIQVRGQHLFTEYLNNPAATAAAFDGDWFRTGDMATRDTDGDIRIVGRKSTDLIKSGGYKIGAGEIENALLNHPGVAEAAVTGEPDPDLGERIVAWIVAADEPATPAQLRDHVATTLAPHKRPRRIRFVPSLPRNAMGKIMKKSLHE